MDSEEDEDAEFEEEFGKDVDDPKRVPNETSGELQSDDVGEANQVQHGRKTGGSAAPKQRGDGVQITIGSVTGDSIYEVQVKRASCVGYSPDMPPIPGVQDPR